MKSDPLDKLTYEDLLKYARHFEAVNKLLLAENGRAQETLYKVLEANKGMALEQQNLSKQISSLVQFISKLLKNHPDGENLARKWNKVNAPKKPKAKFIDIEDLERNRDTGKDKNK